MRSRQGGLLAPALVLIAGCSGRLVSDDQQAPNTTAGGSGEAGAGGKAGAPDGARPGPDGEVRAVAKPVRGGGIDVVIADREMWCWWNAWDEATVAAGCEAAWQVRMTLGPDQLHVGHFSVGRYAEVWSSFDAFGAEVPSEGGSACENLSHYFEGELTIESIDDGGIIGTLSGAGPADGRFEAPSCASCKITSAPCSSNFECCKGLCAGGTCIR